MKRDNRRIILHILPKEKFTKAYIDFMTHRFKYMQHKFVVVCDSDYSIDGVTTRDDVSIINIKEGVDDATTESALLADKIIISGIFGGVEAGVLRWFGYKQLKKTYLQFWGGDFYSYRETKILTKKWVRKKRLHFCIKKSAGIITLVPGDYDELSKIFPNKTPHYVASMPDGSVRKIKEFDFVGGSADKKAILLGNSATPENCHMDALEAMRHLKDEDIKIICPLSYGDREYAKEVAEFGREFFGDKFCPILDFMEIDKYSKLISSCAVGIFNNNRQQAMGNINMMLEMGRKVYLRPGTSMWKCFRSFGIKIYAVDMLRKQSIEEVFSFNKKVAISNRKAIIRKNEEYDNNWSIILDI